VSSQRELCSIGCRLFKWSRPDVFKLQRECVEPSPSHILPILDITDTGLPLLTLTANKNSFLTLLDSGATVSFIQKSFAVKLNKQLEPPSLISLTCADGNMMTPVASLTFSIKLGTRTITHKFHVMENIKNFAFPCVIGGDIIISEGLVIDQGAKKFWFRDEPANIYPLLSKEGVINMVMTVKDIQDYPNNSTAALVETTVRKFQDVFTAKDEVGPARGECHKIYSPDNKPVRSPPVAFPPELSAEIERQVQDLLKRGLIQRSHSPYGANVVLAEKKNGKWRMAINYKRLNKDTTRNSVPMHKSSTILRQLPNGWWYTLLDGDGGFWQLPLRKSDIPKTAFYANGQLYEWKVMPFGLMNAPASFVEFMNDALKDFVGKFLFVYMDDIIIFSKTLEEHLGHVEQVLQRLREKNFTLNRAKCHFAKRELDFLGHVVSKDGIKKQPEKVRAIRDFPTPTSVKEIYRFHGMCVWYASFIQDFATIAEPLYRLLRKNVEFKWGKEQQESFDKLKEAMEKDVMLQGIDYSKPIYVKSDASVIGISAILCQDFLEKEKVIFYASKLLNRAEKNLLTCEQECLAIVWSLNKFRELIYGQPIIVITDNSTITYLDSMRGKSRKLTRWALLIDEFEVKIHHRPGKQNVVPDALSRAPVAPLPNEPNYIDSGKDIMYLPIVFSLFTSFSIKKLKKEQETDEETKLITSKLHSSQEHSENYKIMEGILYRVLKRKQGESPAKRNVSVPFIPKSLRREILHLFHDTPEAGHFGVKKTKRAIRNRVYWPNMMKEIQEYVQSCETCQKCKNERKLPAGLLGTTSPPTAIFETLHIDFIGPLPPSAGGRRNKFVLVVLDELSKWPEFFPMRSSTAKNVAEKLEDQVFCRFGAPKNIISDNGSQFISKVMKKLCKEWNIKHRLISTYHPQSNASERTNQTLKQLIRSFVDSHSDWDLHLQKFALAIRSSVSETTKVSPALLNLGRELPLLFDRNMQVRDAQTSEPENLASETSQKLKELIVWVRRNIEAAHETSKKYYDKHHREVQYSPNQKVLLRTHTLSSKDMKVSAGISQKWSGPFTVEKQVTPVTYAIKEFRKGKYSRNRHVSDMKPYIERKTVVPKAKPVPVPLIHTRRKPRVDYKKLHLGK
jgi:hypothetical protein